MQLRPQLGLDLLLPLFAAAILGGIGSVYGAVAGGLIVGLAESLSVPLIGAQYRAATAFMVLIAILLIRPTGLFGEKTLLPDLVGLLSYSTFFLVFAAIFAIIALGLNLQWGFTGLFNVGVAGFVGIGAYTSALLTAPDYPDQIGGLGLPVPVGWVGSMVASGLAALVVGVAALGCGDYLAIATFGIAVTLQLVALNAQRLTGGPFSLQFIPKPLAAVTHNLAWNATYRFDRRDPAGPHLPGAGTARAEPLGPGAASHPGGRDSRCVSRQARRFRLQAFVISCMLMGLGGALYAHFVGYIAPEDFLPILTFQLWTMLIVGSGNNGAPSSAHSSSGPCGPSRAACCARSSRRSIRRGPRASRSSSSESC